MSHSMERTSQNQPERTRQVTMAWAIGYRQPAITAEPRRQLAWPSSHLQPERAADYLNRRVLAAANVNTSIIHRLPPQRSTSVDGINHIRRRHSSEDWDSASANMSAVAPAAANIRNDLDVDDHTWKRRRVPVCRQTSATGVMASGQPLPMSMVGNLHCAGSVWSTLADSRHSPQYSLTTYILCSGEIRWHESVTNAHPAVGPYRGENIWAHRRRNLESRPRHATKRSRRPLLAGAAEARRPSSAEACRLLRPVLPGGGGEDGQARPPP